MGRGSLDRMRSWRFFAAGILAILLGFSGWASVPKYPEAKMVINARYEKKEENIEQLYAQGRISDATYDRMCEPLSRMGAGTDCRQGARAGPEPGRLPNVLP